MKTHFLLLFLLVSTFLFSQNGLKAEYYDGKNFNEKKITRTEAAIDFDWNDRPPAKGIDLNEFSARWTGQLTPPVSGDYIFFIRVDDGARLWISDNKVIDVWDLHDSETFKGEIYLDKNKTYDLKVEYFNALFEGEIHLTWQLPTEKPLLGGWMGHNERKIDSKFFSIPNEPLVSIPKNETPLPKVEKPKVNSSPKPKAKPENKPIVVPTETAKPIVTKELIEKYTPKNILFVKSKSIMEAGSLVELDQLASMLIDYPVLKVVVEGHTDNVGNAEKNLKLSEERAKVVADYLVSKGVESSRVQSIGFGSSRPIYTPGENAKNRRVEFVIN
jgi:peptidoglycan-binding protein ArfA